MPACQNIQTYQPSPKQNLFHADPSKFRLMLGAWRAGKSVAMIWEMILLGLEYPGARFVLFRKTYPALRDTSWRDFLAECPPELIIDEKKTEGREEVTLEGGTKVLARCLDDWRKLGSASFDLIAGDEAYEFTDDDFQMLSKGRLSGKVGPRRLILATNPPNRDHWLYKRFVLEKQDNMTVHHFATMDNVHHCTKKHVADSEAIEDETTQCARPIDDMLPDGTAVHSNLPPGYIDELKKMPENKRRRFLDGEWGFTAKGTPVFTEFQESRHVAALRTEPNVEVLRGWDFGYRHPACVWAQVLPTGHVHVLHELMGQDEEIDLFARRVQGETARLFPNNKMVDYCDIAGTQKNDLGITCVQVLRKHGISPRFRKLRIWKTIEGIRDLISRTSLGVPLLRVNASCTWVREAFEGGYVLHVTPDGEEAPKKDGTYDHCMDALRYALADHLQSGSSSTVPLQGQALPQRQRVAV